jgi:hypothetical protein
MTHALRSPLPEGGTWFRIFQIDLDDRERVFAVHAFLDPATLSVTRGMAGEHMYPGDVAGVGQRHAQVRFPRDVLLELYRATGRIRGDDPRYPITHPVYESLNRVYCALIDGEDS